jgi:hypothetical protein
MMLAMSSANGKVDGARMQKTHLSCGAEPEIALELLHARFAR